MNSCGLARGNGVIERVQERLHLPDRLLARRPRVLPLALRGERIEAQERLQEELAEAEVLFFVVRLRRREQIVEFGRERRAHCGELGVDGGEECALFGGEPDGGGRLWLPVGDDGRVGGAGGGEEDDDGAGDDVILGEGGVVVVEDGALVDELKVLDLGVFLETLTQGLEGRVAGRQGEGETLPPPLDSHGHGGSGQVD
ncbi:hypothetical protein D9611_000318 [Ephemerocybe angulata]|uniref:Uncharacterized protein n=1 Tax=Ephemerocybe angulata TaxID=980116 RepID=A0A8H5BM25_9AGAR|nr:hypothetical protein D9611_000318 [Tulosesus angulatus]